MEKKRSSSIKGGKLHAHHKGLVVCMVLLVNRHSCGLHVLMCGYCPFQSDDDTASQGKGESMLENSGRSLHTELIKV